MRRLLVVAFAMCCAAPLAAQRALLDRLPPDADVADHTYLGFGAELDPWALPGEGIVLGFAKVRDQMWVARGTRLHCVEWPSRREVRAIDAPPGLVALCADERFLYGVAGTDLHVLDPLAGRSVHSVALATVWPPSAITMHGGKLHALVDKTVMTVNPATGAVQEMTQLTERAHWIAGDGERLWCGDAAGCRPFAGAGAQPDPTNAGWATGTWTSRAWPVPVRESAALWIDGRLLVAVEHGDAKAPVCEAGLLAPAADQPAQRLQLHISTGADGKLEFLVGDERAADEQALVTELARLARDGASWIRDANGKRTRMPVTIDAWTDVKVRDVARAWDLALAAGFTSIHCPALEGWVRKQQADAALEKREKPAPPAPKK